MSAKSGDYQMPWESSTRRKDPPGWSSIRKLVIARAQGQCEYLPPATGPHQTSTRCSYPGKDVDHIINLANGGTDTLDNLQLLCDWHHKQKTQAEAKRNRKPRTERHPGEKHPGIID